jgi:hypothetical protein
MPRVGSYAAAPGQWAGNRSMLADIDEQDERSKQNDLREQDLQLREKHMNDVNALAQQAAQLHDQQVTAKLAAQDTLIAAEKQKAQDTASAWKELGNLDSKDPAFQAKFATIGTNYSDAFDNSSKETENGLSAFAKDLALKNATYLNSVAAQKKEIGALEESSGVPMIYKKDANGQDDLSNPDFAAHGKAAQQAKLAVAQSLAGDLPVKSAGISGEGKLDVQYGSPVTPKGAAIADDPEAQAAQLHQQVNKQLIDKHGITASQLLNPVSMARGKVDPTTNAFTNQYTGADSGPYRQVVTSGATAVIPESD